MKPRHSIHTISKITDSNVELIVLGDFNYNMLSNTESKPIKSLCHQNSLKQVIESPTRITETSSSLLDIILTNRPHNAMVSDVVPLGISDHNLVYVTRKIYRQKLPPRTIRYRSFKRFDENKFREALQGADWNQFLSANDPNTAWDTWKQLFLEISDMYAPIVTRRMRGKKTPWVNEEYIKLSHERDRLKKTCRLRWKLCPLGAV